jgi:ribulose bisphosphate carboxylase small subunit
MSESEQELLRRAFWIMCKTPSILLNQKHHEFLTEVELCLQKIDEQEVTGIPV